MTPRPSYGVDGYPYLIGLLSAALLLCVGGSVLIFGGHEWGGGAALSLGVLVLAPGLLGLHYVTFGKLALRDRLLDLVSFHGAEEVLDVGTGSGLMLIGAALRITRGHAFGVDIWSSTDLSSNTQGRTLTNAALAGVKDRVSVLSADARELPFANDSMDLIFSVLCLHNISERQDAALGEIMRVLKPGGTAVISDLGDTARYQQRFAAAGWHATRSSLLWRTFPFQRVVVARKPLALGAVASA